jgi:diguanylate cyclase (GGDEF)-like protein
MERPVVKRFQALPPTRAVLIVVILFLLVAAIDKATGSELSISLFYLLPVALVSFRWRGAAGQLAAVTAALAWLAIDLGSGTTYSNPLIPFWNATARFGFFSLFSYVLDRLQGAVERQTSLALTDSLTGLPNRRAFEELARRELAQADRTGSPLALALIDIDNFKLINDQLGHAGGDLVLRRFAATTRRILRSADVAARVGGDEFALILPGVDAPSAAAALERFRTSLVHEPDGPIGCSIGVALVAGGELADALRNADQALYVAKASGKGAIELVEVPAARRPPRSF